jgi:hypothetical protein
MHEGAARLAVWAQSWGCLQIIDDDEPEADEFFSAFLRNPLPEGEYQVRLLLLTFSRSVLSHVSLSLSLPPRLCVSLAETRNLSLCSRGGKFHLKRLVG